MAWTQNQLSTPTKLLLWEEIPFIPIYMCDPTPQQILCVT